MSWFTFTWQNFWFSFLALAFEGLPFVLLGSLISGAIAAFVPSKIITGILPKYGFLAAVLSGLVVRRLDPGSILRAGAVKIPTRKRLAFSVSPLPDAENMGV